MSRDSDDDALRWEGDDDPTLAPGWKAVGAPAQPEAADEGTDEQVRQRREDGAAASGDEVETSDAPPQTASATLVILGVLGGVYLLYAVGWLIVAVRSTAPGASIVGDAMYVLGLWFAVLAPALWFAVVLLATERPRARLSWLALGVVVLVPLPFVLGMNA
ncbi:hypothetical protein [Agromyces subbeticus]|uniref:hypothetical protein n=1 Tax=Agromyces subbeticus TaxID=293890 RepID=UPI0003FDC9CA|nr:hypothetical protein [Agromyces subbeticus]